MTASAAFQTRSLFFSYGAAGLFWGTLAAASPALQARAGLDAAGFGLALGSMALAALPVMRSFGARLHRFESRAIPGTFLAFTVGVLLIGFAPGLWGLIAGLVVAGAASGAMDIALNNRTARIETDFGARLFNRTHALFPAAMLAASAGTGALRDLGVPVSALFAGVAAALILAAAIEGHAGGHMRPASEIDESPPPRAAFAGTVAILAIIAAAGAFQEASSLAWAAIFIETVQGGSPTLAGLAPALFTLGLSAGRLVAHGVELRLSAAATVRIAAVIAIPAFVAIALGVPTLPLLLAFFLAGAGVGPIEPAVFRAVATRSQGAERGRTLATVTAVAYLGYLFSPPVLGLVADTFGFGALWALAALFAAGVVGLTLRLGRD